MRIQPRDQQLLEEAYNDVIRHQSENLLLYIEGVYDPHIFKAIFMTGPMGAGKSTVAKKLVGGTGLRSLNLDNFNELMIKKGQVEGGNLTPDQLQQSWEKVQKQKTNFLEGRLGLLIDGSGRNIDDIKENLEKLLLLGYDIACIMVNVDVDVSIERAKKRAAMQAAQHGAGRNVPEDLQRRTHADIQRNIPALQKIFKNNFFEIDNTNTPNLEAVQKLINRFMSMPPSKPAALQWIQQQKQQRRR
jgi:cytidylate kinase